MARVLLDIKRPTVGLLNIGVEEVKGLEEVRSAGQLLREADLPGLAYYGFVEGDDIGKGMQWRRLGDRLLLGRLLFRQRLHGNGIPARRRDTR